MIAFIYNGVTHNFRNPEFTNTNELSFQRINRMSRGGDLHIFRDTDWPKTEALSLLFSFPEEVDLERLQKLIQISVGEVMTYTDHEGTTWSGVIQNPNAKAVQTGRNSRDITIVFEGEQV